MTGLKLSVFKKAQLKNQFDRWLSASPAEIVRKWTSLILIVVICFPGCKQEINDTLPDSVKEAAKTNLAATTTNATFSIVVLPDTQNYMSGFWGGTEAMFTSQINWIKNNAVSQNIVYVAGLGDITEHGDDSVKEWTKAKNGYYSLEASGIPYGLAVGNHDQTPFQGHILSENTNQYNQYFGVSHFSGRTYYGGHYGNNNNSHFDLFSAGGKDFIVIYLEYDQFVEDAAMTQWAYDQVVLHSSRKAIVVTHFMIGVGEQSNFGDQGKNIYAKLKSLPNVFMFLGGHIYGVDLSGEGYREDTYGGSTIRTYLSDYQQRMVAGQQTGGNGMLRVMTFSVDNDDVTVKTYSPHTKLYETDPNSQFTKPLFGPPPAAVLPDGKYKIIARHSGKALVVYNASKLSGASIVQWDYTHDTVTNDEWNFTKKDSSGYYRITNVNSNLDMNVQGISTDVGGLLVQYAYNSAPPTNDEFGLISVGGGYYKIIARHSGLCFNVAGANNTNGALLKQWTYVGDTNEQFQIVPVTP